MKKLTLLLSAMLLTMMSFAATTVTMDFTSAAGLQKLGIAYPADSTTTEGAFQTELVAGQAYTQESVSLTATHGSTPTRIWLAASGSMDLRHYKTGVLTFAAPTGKVILKVKMAGGNVAGFADAAGGIWTGEAATVALTADANAKTIKISTIEVTYGNPGEDVGSGDSGSVDPGKTTIEIPAEAKAWNIPAEAIDVLQARAICANLANGATTGTKYYVMGYVKKLHAKHESGVSGYGNAQFFMENVKGADSMDDFLAYQVYGLNGEKITDPSVVEVGDFVVVYGELTNYNGTYETVGKGAAYIWNSTNSLLSGGNTNPPTPPTTEGVITCAEAVEICKATGETATTETYTIRGYVTEIKEAYTDQYKNVSCWMADEKGGGQVFLAFRVKPTTDADQAVKVNDYIEVKGNLVNYYGNTPETTAGGSMTIITVGEEGEKPSLPEGLTGDGTEANPYTVEDVIKLNSLSKGPHYVRAYIVGQVAGKSITTGAEFTAPFSTSTDTTTFNTNLLVASTLGETDVTKCLPLQLPIGDLRNAFNLPENPDMHGKEVLIYGNLEAYFGVPGIKSPSSIVVLTPQDPNLVTIKGLEYADAFYEAYNNTWLIYLYPETEEFDPEVHTNLTLIITPKSSTAINGTYDLQTAMYFVSETDHVSGFDSTKPASVTIKNIDNEGNYSFVGSFVGEDAKTYTFDQVVNVFAIDSDTEEEIVLEETNTAVENVYVGENPVKFIENGQLMIIRGENVYNVLGAQVK